MTLIGVKLRKHRNLYVLVLYVPGSRRKVLECRVARRPWEPVAVGDVLRAGRRRVRVTELRYRTEDRGGNVERVTEHVTDVYTRAVSRQRAPRVVLPPNVVRMPAADHSIVAQFIRCHVLIRIFGGDADAWLAQLRADGSDDGDLRFVRWVRSRLRRDPALLASIRKMVEATPFWRVAEA